MMKTKHVILLSCIAGMLLASGCGREETRESESHHDGEGMRMRVSLARRTVEEMGITLTPVRRGEIRLVRDVPAVVIPNQNREAQVGSLLQGRVHEIFVDLGDRVRAGQQLMQIEGLEIGEIKASYIKAKAQLDIAETALRRQKSLLAQEVGSRKSLQEAQLEYDKALAEFNAEDKKIHSIGLADADLLKFFEDGSRGLEEHTRGVLPVNAPISGTVVERNVVKGQLVELSTTAFRILDTSVLWADGQVPETDLPAIGKGAKVTLTFPAYPSESFEGTISYISPMVDPKTRMLTVRATVPNPRERLKPQMFGEMHIPVAAGGAALTIPAESVIRDGGGASVYVAVTDTLFERRPIVEEGAAGDRIIVRSGLREGERIVVRGAFLLKSESLKETFGEAH